MRCEYMKIMCDKVVSKSVKKKKSLRKQHEAVKKILFIYFIWPQKLRLTVCEHCVLCFYPPVCSHKAVNYEALGSKKQGHKQEQKRKERKEGRNMSVVNTDSVCTALYTCITTYRHTHNTQICTKT